MQYLKTLTGLRGLAAFIVFISHSANESILPRVFGEGFGQVGVMLFFILSGFLMAHLYIHKEVNKKNLRKYIFARIGRVFPLYFLLLISSIAITLFISSDSFFPYKFEEMDKTIRALLLIDAPYVFWTIPVEIQFYVLFIGFWALYKSQVKTYWLLVFVFLTMLPSVIMVFLLPKLPKVISFYSFAFFIGSITALLFDKIKQTTMVKTIADNVGILLLVLIFINLPVLRSQYGLAFENVFLKTWGDPITWCIVYAVFIAAALNSKTLFMLNSKVLIYLGSISYGFYLIHYPVLMFFSKEVNIEPYAQFLLALLVTVALSHLSFHYFEKPTGAKIRAMDNVNNAESLQHK